MNRDLGACPAQIDWTVLQCVDFVWRHPSAVDDPAVAGAGTAYSKIRDQKSLCRTAILHQHVLGLQIHVHNVPGMNVCQPTRDLDEGSSLFPSHGPRHSRGCKSIGRASLDPRAKVAIAERHQQALDPVAWAVAEAVSLQNVGVAQTRHRKQLTPQVVSRGIRSTASVCIKFTAEAVASRDVFQQTATAPTAFAKLAVRDELENRLHPRCEVREPHRCRSGCNTRTCGGSVCGTT